MGVRRPRRRRCRHPVGADSRTGVRRVQHLLHHAQRRREESESWGLYDTLGNVWEWVQDFYNEKIFADPAPPKSGTVHVLKGGGFLADVKNAIPATHAGGPGSGFDVGFRVVREVR